MKQQIISVLYSKDCYKVTIKFGKRINPRKIDAIKLVKYLMQWACDLSKNT